MTEKDFFQSYCKFADFTTSEYGKDDNIFKEKTGKLSAALNGNYSRLDNAVSGISGEAGEIADLWKKIKFHGKEFNEENKEMLVKELGDMFWYLAQASIALNVSMEEIINKNIEKLKARHPNGFSDKYMK
ncbi:MAG: nucleoside triphosphate pyrophosphohydrolase family protein [Lactobacillaceae bacterium]|jgi:NTP pyrophosphatase (non-canonical NTP hydrolase)|nr:nucleoside triphosphate pyrophosphohydrolase family protein [Lactobacillaceae bacterium]